MSEPPVPTPDGDDDVEATTAETDTTETDATTAIDTGGVDTPAGSADDAPDDHPATPTGSRRVARTWPQRLTIAGVLAAAFSAFVAAGVLAAGQWVVSSRNLVVLETTPPDARPDGGSTIVVPDLDGDGIPDQIAGAPAEPAEEPEPFPDAEPDAKNFLITGADNNACIDPDSPFAGAFGDVHEFGERSDTIMVWRVNPGTDQVAVLSFPRDLWVDIEGRSGRINSAYRHNDPSRLRATILDNFGISVDHYVQVDFCAFKRLVDAVGGVEVPFEYPARDTRTGLDVPEVGCFNFQGDHALAYVRSRRYQYEDPVGSGNWRTDGTSDLGRISRQQDFLRRTVATVLNRGAYSPSVVRALIDTNSQYLTIDTELTVNRMLEFAGVLQTLDASEISSYQIESTRRMISGNDVQVPRLDGDNMQAILAVFRGEAQLAEAPEQEFDTTTTSTPRPDANSTTTTSVVDEAAADTGDTDEGDVEPVAESTTPTDETIDAGPTTTLPEVVADENILGVYPPRDATC